MTTRSRWLGFSTQRSVLRCAAPLIHRNSSNVVPIRTAPFAIGLCWVSRCEVRRPSTKHAATVRAMLGDKAPAPRIAAAETLGVFGSDDDVLKAIDVCVDLAPADKNGAAVSILALNALDSMGTRAKPALSRIRDIATKDPDGPARLNEYPPQLVKVIMQRLGHA